MASVLYVDDEEAIRRAVITWLSRRGHSAHGAATIADARELLSTQSFDGAFIDLWLGVESGLELQDWIDEHLPAFASRIVFVTGDLMTGEAAQRALASFGRPVLGKPFDLEQLDEWVARWCAA